MSDRKPNIVFVMADDMGYGDVGCFNPASKIPTPNMDRVAAEGARFTDAHSSSAVCTPSRYSVLTGRYCWRTSRKSGVGGMFAIRQEGWKLIGGLGSGGFSEPRHEEPEPGGPKGQLYDLAADLRETTNLWLDRPEVVELAAQGQPRVEGQRAGVPRHALEPPAVPLGPGGPHVLRPPQPVALQEHLDRGDTIPVCGPGRRVFAGLDNAVSAA